MLTTANDKRILDQHTYGQPIYVECSHLVKMYSQKESHMLECCFISGGCSVLTRMLQQQQMRSYAQDI